MKIINKQLPKSCSRTILIALFLLLGGFIWLILPSNAHAETTYVVDITNIGPNGNTYPVRYTCTGTACSTVTANSQVVPQSGQQTGMTGTTGSTNAYGNPNNYPYQIYQYYKDPAPAASNNSQSSYYEPYPYQVYVPYVKGADGKLKLGTPKLGATNTYAPSTSVANANPNTGFIPTNPAIGSNPGNVGPNRGFTMVSTGN